MAGKVFENLLAAYNPETATTARKQTGSFYTPREIVDYMVDEALIAYLTTRLTAEIAKNAEKKSDPESSALSASSAVEKKLRHLLAYNDEPHQFSPAEVETLIAAIDNLKALDPACGSGAFPMGLLHKLVFILGKLDPRNEQWEHRQIAKMRFFISLVVDQKVNPCSSGRESAQTFASGRGDQSQLTLDATDWNMGIRPLPNLETKFVAANTLIGIEKSRQQMLRNPQIDAKEAELRQVRERHFTARTPATKVKCRELDAKLRAEISQLLRADGFAREITEKLAIWNPYDQNASADFFDPEWMFGLREGFHIVIGNPPYVRVDELRGEDKALYRGRYTSTTRKYDLYYLFIEYGLKALTVDGVLSFITPNKFCAATSGATLRALILARARAGEVVSTSKLGVFEEAANYPVIAHYHVGSGNGSFLVREAVSIDAIRQSSPKVYRLPIPSFRSLPEGIIPINISQAEVDLAIRLLEQGTLLGSVFSISEGLRLPTACEREQKSDFMIVKQFQFEKWTEIRKGAYITEMDLKRVVSDGSDRFLKINRPKIVVAEDALEITATLDMHTCVPQGGVYFGVVTESQVDLAFILGLLNSHLMSRIYEILFGGMHMGGGYLRYRTNFMEALPIPELKALEQSKLSVLVDKILAAKRADAAADTRALGREIDEGVYRLYGLTVEEIKLVEGETK